MIRFTFGWLTLNTAKKPNPAADHDDDFLHVLFRNFRTQNIMNFKQKPLKAKILKFPRRGVVGLHVEPNSSYSVMNKAPTDQGCAALTAQSRTRNFWAKRAYNGNCQQIKTWG